MTDNSCTDRPTRTLGIIGAGHIGSELARSATRHGWTVVISNSRGPATLVDLVDELGDQARAATAAEAAEAGDLVVVTVPLRAIGDLPLVELAGRTVVATGPRAQDLAVRLAYAGVEHRTVPDLAEALHGHAEPVG